MKTLTCSCCGADVTKPQFFDGKVYGYTCIKKVAPQQKQTQAIFEEATILKQINVANRYFDLCVVVNGKKLRHLVPMSEMSKIMHVQDGVTFVVAKAFKNWEYHANNNLDDCWIDKVQHGYMVSLKDTMMSRYNDGVFQASFKEAKEYALQWAEGGTYDQHN